MSNMIKKMQKAYDRIDNYFCESDEFMDYIDCCYGEATEKLSEKYTDLYIEPSTQCGRGGVFATYTVDGVIYRVNWDYESECECIDDYVLNCNSEEEFINSLVGYIEGHLEDAEPDDEEDE